MIAAPTSAVAAARPTVVLLHGLARTSRSMAALRRRLESAGYPTWARSYPSRQRTIAGAADEIAGWLARDLPAGAPLAAVTHSLGGVIIRYVAARVPFQQVVMLAPPSNGSRVGRALYRRGIYRWFFGPAGQELAAPHVARGWPALTVPFAVIAGTRGRALANPTSWLTGARGYFARGQAHDGTLSVDETALDGMAAFATVDASHTWIMNDPRVHRLVLEFLETRAFAAVVGGAARDVPG